MLSNYCRICLTSIGVVHQLEEVVHKSLTLYEMLCKMYPEACGDNNEPQWPTRVCRNCKHGLLEAYRLYVVCMSTLSVLKKHMQNSATRPSQLSAKIDIPEKSNTRSGHDGIDFKNAVIIIDDEEDEEHCLTSEQEEEFDSEQKKTNGNEHEGRKTFSLSDHQANAHESIENTFLLLHPQNAKSLTNECGAETWKSCDIVERSIKVASSIDQEQMEDSEESMEYLDNVEDSLDASGNDDNQAETAMVEEAVTEYAVSATIINSERQDYGSDESEGEDIFAKMFSSEIFSCKSCRDVFLDKESHVKHMKNHSKGCKKFCKMCNEGFKNESALCAHECYSNTSILCWICGEITTASRKHETHMLSHRPKEMWACNLCPLRFNYETVLKAHLNTHKRQKLYCCDICGMNLVSKRNFEKHQWTRHKATKEELYTVSCGVCSQKFTDRYVLKRHMNTHTGLRPYSCVYCNRVYGSGGDLVEHVAKHHVGNDNIYQCHLCDADFPKIKELKGHYEVHCRNGEQLYNEILTEFGKFRFTTMDLLKMRRRKEMMALSSDNANNQFPSSS
ncbi:histone-lysine N-methyltransferase PRDM9-like [Anopheles albimanus]|uniref:histone-lysine N-methyltransferase PRDM9-like n=1 Tax=Anopheles albimanus TaxID=7167 RepID=UPI00163F30DB|nr:histone-lysine N-methyltransferase PRDM9-like [Anopheles albimanus]